MGEKDTFAVRIDEDSDVYEEFEKYKSRGGFESTSETLRDIMRAQLTEQSEAPPTGFAAALSKVAGSQLTRSMDLLAKYIIVTAVALMAFNAGVFGGVVWAGVAAVYGTLAGLTVIAVGVGAAEILNPDGVEPSKTAAKNADEVEQ